MLTMKATPNAKQIVAALSKYLDYPAMLRLNIYAEMAAQEGGSRVVGYKHYQNALVIMNQTHPEQLETLKKAMAEVS